MMDLIQYGEYPEIPDCRGHAMTWSSGTLIASMELTGVLHSAWDEKRVGEWLHSIKAGNYEQLFRGEFTAS